MSKETSGLVNVASEASGKIKQDNDEMTKPKPTKKAAKMQSELVKVQESNRNIASQIDEIYKIVNQIDRKIGNTMELFERNIINRYNQHIEMLENDIESLNESNHALVNKIKSLKF